MQIDNYPNLYFRRKFLKFFGASIDIRETESNQLVGFISMQAFKLREDIRLYTDESKNQEIMHIHARNIIDFGATYDVIDTMTGQTMFSMRRKGLRSTFVRDKWLIFDVNDQQIGELNETSSVLAIARRWLGAIAGIFEIIFSFVPQTYELTDNAGTPCAHLEHRINPFIVKIDLKTAPSNTLGPRVPVAITALIATIDAVKN